MSKLLSEGTINKWERFETHGVYIHTGVFSVQQGIESSSLQVFVRGERTNNMNQSSHSLDAFC